MKLDTKPESTLSVTHEDLEAPIINIILGIGCGFVATKDANFSCCCGDDDPIIFWRKKPQQRARIALKTVVKVAGSNFT